MVSLSLGHSVGTIKVPLDPGGGGNTGYSGVTGDD